MRILKLQLKIWFNALLLCHRDVVLLPMMGVLDFLQRVWPFSYLVFTEAARNRRRILKQLAESRESFYSDPEVRHQIIDGGER